MHDSAIKPGERVKDVHLTEDRLAVDLIDGRTIVVPLTWYTRPLDASPHQLRNWTRRRRGLWYPLAGHRRRLKHRWTSARSARGGGTGTDSQSADPLPPGLGPLNARPAVLNDMFSQA
jgi:hypothetical protein